LEGGEKKTKKQIERFAAGKGEKVVGKVIQKEREEDKHKPAIALYPSENGRRIAAREI